MISIIIPTFNRSNLLQACVSSVLDQSYANWELLIVDDGSTDNTRKAVERYSDPRIRYLGQSNAGAASARNHGALEARGEYIVFLDSDDAADPCWLEVLERAADQHQSDIVTCGFRRYGPTGNLLEEKSFSSGHQLQQAYGIFLAGTYLIRKSIFLQTGGFDISLRSGHHTELSIRLIQQKDAGTISMHAIPDMLVRIHDHGGEKIRSNWQSVFDGSQAILKKHFAFMRQSKYPWLQSYYTVLARAAHELKRSSDARHYGWLAVKSRPQALKNWLRLLRYGLSWVK